MQILSVYEFFSYFSEQSLVKNGIPLFEKLKLAILQNVLCTSDFQKLQSLDLRKIFDFLIREGGAIELMNSAVE